MPDGRPRFGVLAWRYVTEYGFGGKKGASVISWRLGRSLGRRAELVAPTDRKIESLSLATNQRGTAIALYSELEFPQSEGATRVATIDAARLSAGKVLARQQVATITGGRLPSILRYRLA
jgi:hypothetical protein